MKKIIRVLSLCVVMMFVFAFSSFGKTESNTVNSDFFNTGKSVKTQKTNKSITSIQMSNGKTAFYHWRKASSGNLVLEGIKFEGGKFIKCSVLEEEAGTECRDAAFAAGVALAVCAVSPGSVACWSSTATAAYLAYKCYESTHPSLAMQITLITKPNKRITVKDSAKFHQSGRRSSTKKLNLG